LTTIAVPKEIINKYTILSIEKNKRRNKLIVEALEEYLKKNDKKDN